MPDLSSPKPMDSNKPMGAISSELKPEYKPFIAAGGKKFEAQLFNIWPSANEQARKLYTPIEECIYTTKHIGDSGQVEIMTCECPSEYDSSGVNHACGDDSDCINRLTSIECRNDHSSCGKNCQNQRFQKKAYAPLDVILTEKKGLGLRALEDIPSGSFIIEYVGEVIDDRHWRKRMETYEREGVKHFYFMMLQKGQLIDATKKGSFSRFANHSCRPNCAVEKWVVKDKLRMGIFSSRHIYKGEEITFDYNVDRFGADAQPCYCGESNCIGFLGGKTQTEAASKLPQLLIDALGLDDEDEDHWITTTASMKKRGKKSGKIDVVDIDEEYAANLPVKPIDPDHVSKVMGSLLQCQENWLVSKLTERIHMTNNKDVDLQVMKMHGYQIFSTLLKQRSDDEQIVTCILEILSRWPKVTKNKISSSQIEVTITELSKKGDYPVVAELSKSILREWSELKMAYRIPRRDRAAKSATPETTTQKDDAAEIIEKAPMVTTPTQPKAAMSDPPNKPKGSTVKKLKDHKPKLPKGWFSALAPSGQTYYYNADKTITTWEWPGEDLVAKELKKKEAAKEILQRSEMQLNLQKIIEEASKKPLSSTASPATEPSATPDEVRVTPKPGLLERKESDRSQKTTKKNKSKEEDVEKKLTKTLARYVPNQIARYEEELGHEQIKNVARDIVQILVSKEIRVGQNVKSPGEMTDSRKAKVKAFIKVYMEKFLAKFRQKRALKHGNHSDSSSSPAKKIRSSSAAGTCSSSSKLPPASAEIDLGGDEED